MRKLFSSLTHRSRRIFVASGAILLLYVLALAGTFAVVWRSAERKTEALLGYAEGDLRDSVDEVVDATLSNVGVMLTDYLGSARALPREEMHRLARDYNVDEVNIVNRAGIIISTNDPTADGLDMANQSAETAGFMVLTNGRTKIYSQKFRRSVNNPEVVRKYFGIAFPNGDGFIELGYDERRLARSFTHTFGGLLSKWRIGETGFYLCADKAYSRVVTSVPNNPGSLDMSLADVGLDIFEIPKNDGETFVQTVFGKRCYCRHFIYARHRMFSVLPAEEFYGPAIQSLFFVAAVLLVVFFVFGYVLGHMVNQQRRIAALRKLDDLRREKDLSMARTIQTASLPAIFPPYPEENRMTLFAHMDTAKEVGGDFYDFYRLDADRLVLVMADVSGKGIPGAMFMMRAKAILKSCLTATDDFDSAVTDANARLSEGNNAQMFVTCWICVIDLRTGRVQYVNAGHNPPYLRHADGTLEKLSARSGLPLAALDDMHYHSHFVTLHPGDTLVLYTDGVTEAQDPSGELFGERRLEQALSAGETDVTEVCDSIRKAVVTFARDAEQSDDITLLAMRFS